MHFDVWNEHIDIEHIHVTTPLACRRDSVTLLPSVRSFEQNKNFFIINNMKIVGRSLSSRLVAEMSLSRVA